ncbi:MAG: phosphatase PAP2 family protein [Xanthobacteraceae bacterium]|nr:phosphatase PAP2 family protein [Xanthobacteraceae bacterium]
MTSFRRLSRLAARLWRWLRRRAEFAVLAALLLAAAALLGFIALVDEVLEGETHAFDEAILRALRNPADSADPTGPWWLEAMFRDITALGGTTVITLITLAAIVYLLIESKRAAALLVLVSVGGGTLLSQALKGAFARPRPELVAHLVDVRTLSFPSGHAMLSAVTFLTLGALLARVQPRRRLKVYFLGVAVTLTLLIGASRVYLGVHWPTDVLAGWCLGAAWAMLCWAVMLGLQRSGRIADEPEPGEARDRAPARE